MDFDAFKESLSAAQPPSALHTALQALWYDAHGDWQGAHTAAQAEESPTGAWVHAYLHRKEGDIGNAGYWYRRAGKPIASGALEQEWEAITQTLLQQ